MNKKKNLVLLRLVPLLLTGCTRTLKDKDNKVVINEVTGQNLTENILCRPTDEETITRIILPCNRKKCCHANGRAFR